MKRAASGLPAATSNTANLVFQGTQNAIVSVRPAWVLRFKRVHRVGACEERIAARIRVAVDLPLLPVIPMVRG